MSETSHRLDGSDEAMELAFLGSVDEPDVIVRIDLQPIQDRWEVIRDAAAVAFDNRSAGPVDEFEIVLDFVRDRAVGVVGVSWWSDICPSGALSIPPRAKINPSPATDTAGNERPQRLYFRSAYF